MQRRTAVAVLPALLTLLVVLLPAGLSAQASTVRCESASNKRVTCGMPANSQVTIARQLSTTPCLQNQNWGTGPNFIWVDAGCRAEFAVTSYQTPPTSVGVEDPNQAYARQLRSCRAEVVQRLANVRFDDVRATVDRQNGTVTYIRWSAANSSGSCSVAVSGRILEFNNDNSGGNGLPATSRITCASASARREECKVTAGSQVRLVRQMSSSPCRLNDTYGMGQGYVWVDKGCRGEFEVTQPGYGGGNGGGNGLPTVRRIVCESQGAARTECTAPGVSQIRVVRQISQSPCRENSSYGIGFGHIWVSNGCRAEFEVTIPNTSGSVAPAQRVTCESSEGKRTSCRIPFKARVTLARQLSSAACRENDSWGTTPNAVWVSKGCRGEFLVQSLAAGRP